MDDPAHDFAGRLADVSRRIEHAARRAGRQADDITLVAVAKSAPPAIYGVLHAAGLRDVGESRVQAAEERRPHAPAGLHWHLVGHLQSNKVRRAVALFDVLHGIDSPDTLQRVERAAAELGRAPEVYLEVNVSGEASKRGLNPDALPAALHAARALRHARVVGLMTMAPEDAPAQAVRAVFAGLAALRRRHASPALPLPQLSMGMSDDFELAIEEGATVVRIGRRLVSGVLDARAADAQAGGHA